jgi:hypothetical protein
MVRWQCTNIDEEAKCGLEDVDDVTKIVVGYKTVIGGAACNEKLNQLVYVMLLALVPMAFF